MEINDLYFGYDGDPVLKGISLKIKKNAVTTIIGANGCGKTTLLKLMTKTLVPDKGCITLDGMDIRKIPRKVFASKAAAVHQKNIAPEDILVKELVSYGRLPYRTVFSYGNMCDEKAQWAMEATGITDIAERPMGELSGGQRQRAFIAMALAQDTKILFLDEPTTFLDIRYQIEILRLIRKLNEELGITVVMVLHDINQSIAYSDFLVALKDSQVYAAGKPDDVISSESVKDIYGIELSVENVKGTKTVLVQ